MGTVGALTLLKQKPKEAFFVMNGDLLTNFNYEQMLEFHESHNSKTTMCVREYDFQVPYGVVNINNENIAIRNEGINVNKVNKEIYLKLVLEPVCLFLFKKYKVDPFLNIINKKIMSKTTSKINKNCKFRFEKNNRLGLINESKK